MGKVHPYKRVRWFLRGLQAEGFLSRRHREQSAALPLVRLQFFQARPPLYEEYRQALQEFLHGPGIRGGGPGLF